MLRTVSIVPAILSNTKQGYREQVEKINPISRRVQIDISDGEFAPANTINLGSAWWPKTWKVDLHLMAVRPSEYLTILLRLRPNMCILHAEADEDLMPIFKKLKENGIKVGVALMRKSYPGKYRQYIEAADHVLVFAGELGKQGSIADLMQMEKIQIIRAIKPDVEIGWDGGANATNIRALSHANIDVINVGSALTLSENPVSTYQSLVAEIDKTGVVI